MSRSAAEIPSSRDAFSSRAVAHLRDKAVVVALRSLWISLQRNAMQFNAAHSQWRRATADGVHSCNSRLCANDSAEPVNPGTSEL